MHDNSILYSILFLFLWDMFYYDYNNCDNTLFIHDKNNTLFMLYKNQCMNITQYIIKYGFEKKFLTDKLCIFYM